MFNRTKTESRVNAELSPEELHKWDPFTMRIAERNSPVNHILNRLDQKFSDFLILNTTSLSQYSAATVKEFILGVKKEQTKTVLQFVDTYFENVVVKNSNVRPGTVKQYRRAINHLIRFLDIRNQKSLIFDQLDFAFASEFKQYLVNTDPALDKAGMTEVSAATVIKKIIGYRREE
jgi:hypothetical protein